MLCTMLTNGTFLSSVSTNLINYQAMSVECITAIQNKAESAKYSEHMFSDKETQMVFLSLSVCLSM